MPGGIAAERFAVRNSGATAVCEGEQIRAQRQLRPEPFIKAHRMRAV